MSLRFRAVCVLCFVVLLAGCATKKNQVNESVPPQWLKDMPVSPLEVVEYRTATAEGEHAVFLRLSRFPDAMGYSVQEVPPEIIVRLEGPAVGEDVTEERAVISDAVISALRVSRQAGALTVVVELTTPDMPPYRVEEAADWLIVRVKPPAP